MAPCDLRLNPFPLNLISWWSQWIHLNYKVFHWIFLLHHSTIDWNFHSVALNKSRHVVEIFFYFVRKSILIDFIFSNCTHWCSFKNPTVINRNEPKARSPKVDVNACSKHSRPCGQQSKCFHDRHKHQVQESFGRFWKVHAHRKVMRSGNRENENKRWHGCKGNSRRGLNSRTVLSQCIMLLCPRFFSG